MLLVARVLGVLLIRKIPERFSLLISDLYSDERDL